MWQKKTNDKLTNLVSNNLLIDFRDIPELRQFHFLHRSFCSTYALSLLCPLQYLLFCLQIKNKKQRYKKAEVKEKLSNNLHLKVNHEQSSKLCSDGKWHDVSALETHR